MSDDGSDAAAHPGGGTSTGRAYNRPRRYPVQAPPPSQSGPAAAGSGEVTRQNPSYAEAAQEYGRRHTDLPGPPAPVAPFPPPPVPPPPGPPMPPVPPVPPVPPMPSVPPPSRRFSTRALVLVGAGAAVLVVALVIGLIVGLSGDDDSPKPTAADLPTTSAPTTVTPAPSSAPPSKSAAIGGAPPLAADVCTTLGNTAPITDYVARPRPAERIPASYVEPSVGVRVAVCAGFFRPGGGAGRGRIAYVAEYEQLPATRYALTLKTRGWVLVPSLPRATYRNSANTTVTLVQHGTSLITVVGTGG